MVASLALHLRSPIGTGELPDLSPLPVAPRGAEAALRFDHGQGSILVLIEYRVPEANTAAFVRAMEEVGHLRRRDGCWRWDLFEDVGDPPAGSRPSTLASWIEYLRQRRRGTAADEAVIAAARALLDPGFVPVVRRMVHRGSDAPMVTVAPPASAGGARRP
jgi:hypothetical protein